MKLRCAAGNEAKTDQAPGVSTIAPRARNRARNAVTSTCFGRMPAWIAIAAAVPAASPVAMHGGISLVA